MPFPLPSFSQGESQPKAAPWKASIHFHSRTIFEGSPKLPGGYLRNLDLGLLSKPYGALRDSEQLRQRRDCEVQISAGLTPCFSCLRVVGVEYRLLTKRFDQRRCRARVRVPLRATLRSVFAAHGGAGELCDTSLPSRRGSRRRGIRPTGLDRPVARPITRRPLLRVPRLGCPSPSAPFSPSFVYGQVKSVTGP